MTAVVWLVVLLGCLAVWLLSPSPPLLAFLCVLIGAPTISWLLLLPLRKRQTVSLQAPAVIGKGKPAVLTIDLPECGFPLGSALVWLEIENCSTGQVLRRRFRVCRSLQWELVSRYCGGLRCRVTRVWGLDLMGLLPMPLPCTAKKRITVMPDTFPIQIEDSLTVSRRDECEDYAPDRRGQDLTETFQIREYVPGDNLHQIHWKLSGKTGQLLVRDASCPVDHSLMVFVERRWDRVSAPYADALMEAVVSLCQALAEAGRAFHLAWNQAQIQQYPISSVDQLPEAVTALLKSSAVTEGPSGASLYQHLEIPAGHILYFCNQLPPSQELFPANVQTFLCAEGAASGNVTVFTPETMTDVLAHLEGGADF